MVVVMADIIQIDRKGGWMIGLLAGCVDKDSWVNRTVSSRSTYWRERKREKEEHTWQTGGYLYGEKEREGKELASSCKVWEGDKR